MCKRTKNQHGSSNTRIRSLLLKNWLRHIVIFQISTARVCHSYVVRSRIFHDGVTPENRLARQSRIRVLTA